MLFLLCCPMLELLKKRACLYCFLLCCTSCLCWFAWVRRMLFVVVSVACCFLLCMMFVFVCVVFFLL